MPGSRSGYVPCVGGSEPAAVNVPRLFASPVSCLTTSKGMTTSTTRRSGCVASCGITCPQAGHVHGERRTSATDRPVSTLPAPIDSANAWHLRILNRAHLCAQVADEPCVDGYALQMAG